MTKESLTVTAMSISFRSCNCSGARTLALSHTSRDAGPTWVWHEEFVAKALERWPVDVIEEALGEDAAVQQDRQADAKAASASFSLS